MSDLPQYCLTKPGAWREIVAKLPKSKRPAF